MANKSWYETLEEGDCVGPFYLEWNDMVDYIKHSACADFTIYGTCTDSDPIFLFTESGGYSEIYGADATGDDLRIVCNTVDSYPKIEMLGNSQLKMYAASNSLFYSGATKILELAVSGNDTWIYGQSATTKDLKIAANTIDTYPKIELNSPGNLNIYSAADVALCANAAVMFTFNLTGANSIMYGGDATGDDLLIYANNVDTAPLITMRGNSNLFLTTADLVIFNDGADRICSFDRSGANGIMYGPDATGADFTIAANDTDVDAKITLEGNGNIKASHNTSNFFEIQEAGTTYLYFHTNGDDTFIQGKDTAGHDLILKANRSDTYPTITLNGQGNIDYVCDDADVHNFWCESNLGLQIDIDAGITYLKGQSGAGEDLEIAANSNDTGCKIKLNGAGHMNFYVNTDKKFLFYELASDEIFSIEYVGDDTLLKGGGGAADDLKIYANSVATYPFLALQGGTNVSLLLGSVSDANIFFDIQWDVSGGGAPDNKRLFRVETASSTHTNIKGGDTSGDDLSIYASNANSYPYIRLYGNAGVNLYHASTNSFRLLSAATAYLDFYSDTDAVIETLETNQHLYLKPNGSGLVKFGTYAAITAETLAGYITINDAAGNPRKLAVVA